MKPLMQKKEIKIIEKQLFLLGKQNGKIDILEWGSGGSTVYFSKFLEDNNIEYTWTSIEYNRNWYGKVFDLIKECKNTQVVLFDVGNDNLRQRNIEMNEYVDYPKTLNKRFDFILVDGRKRRRCLVEAKDLLSINGVVYLHDAQRKYYHCVLKNYPNSLFVGPFLWRGKNEPVNSFRKIYNKIMGFIWGPFVSLYYFSMSILRSIYHKFPFLQKIRKIIFVVIKGYYCKSLWCKN